MSFDKNDAGPIVVPSKKTTKVNILMVIGVALFFVVGALTIAWLKSTRG